MQPVVPTTELFSVYKDKPVSLLPEEVWGYIFSFFPDKEQFNAIFINKYFLWANLESERGTIYWNSRLKAEFPHSVFNERTPAAEYMHSKFVTENLIEKRVSVKTVDLTHTIVGGGDDHTLNIHCGENRVYLGTQQGNVVWWDLTAEKFGEWGCPNLWRGKAQVHCCRENEGHPYVGYCVGEEGSARGVIVRVSPENNACVFAIITECPVPSFQFYRDTLYVQYDKQTIRAYNSETGIVVGDFFETEENSGVEIVAFRIDEKSGLLYLFLADEDSGVCTLKNIKVFNLNTQIEPIEINCHMKWPGSECIEFAGNCFYDFSKEKKQARKHVIDVEAKQLSFSSLSISCNQKPVALGDHVYVADTKPLGEEHRLYNAQGLPYFPFASPRCFNPMRWRKVQCLGLGKGYGAMQCCVEATLLFKSVSLDVVGQKNPRLVITNFGAAPNRASEQVPISYDLYDAGKELLEDGALIWEKAYTHFFRNEF